jgi:WD40 repeat protein
MKPLIHLVGLALVAAVVLAAMARAEPPEVRLQSDLEQIDCAAISPDGKTIALGGRAEIVELWDLVAGKRLRMLKDVSGNVSSLAFSPEGKTLAVGSYEQVKLWDPTTDTDGPILKGHTKAVRFLRFTPDGKIVTGGDGDGTALRWDVSTGQVASKVALPHAEYETASSDGNTLIAVLNGVKNKKPLVCVWDADKSLTGAK